MLVFNNVIMIQKGVYYIISIVPKICLQTKLKYKSSFQGKRKAYKYFFYGLCLIHSCLFYQYPLRGSPKEIFLTLNWFPACENILGRIVSQFTEGTMQQPPWLIPGILSLHSVSSIAECLKKWWSSSLLGQNHLWSAMLIQNQKPNFGLLMSNF